MVDDGNGTDTLWQACVVYHANKVYLHRTQN